jgi:streptomycin 6-kinase
MRYAIPRALSTNVRALRGAGGAQWLEALPAMIGDLERQWSITVEEPFPNGEYNYVAAAVDSSGTPCVIKIAPPGSEADHLGEAKYLSLSKARGVVRLFAHDRERMAMLIERAIPGRTLTRTYECDEASAVGPAIDLLRTTSRTIPEDRSEIILLDDWFDGLRNFRGTAFPVSYGDRALKIYDKLKDRAEFIGYLHGDFHPDNIVSSDRSNFLLIDPKGMIGHLGYEIAVFLNNFHWWQDEASDIRDRLEDAVGRFSVAFGISEMELREWAFAQMVLSAWWTFDEMPDLYNNEVAKADIWDV